MSKKHYSTFFVLKTFPKDKKCPETEKSERSGSNSAHFHILFPPDSVVIGIFCFSVNCARTKSVEIKFLHMTNNA